MQGEAGDTMSNEYAFRVLDASIPPDWIDPGSAILLRQLAFLIISLTLIINYVYTAEDFDLSCYYHYVEL